MPMRDENIPSLPRVATDASLLSIPTIAPLELWAAITAFYCHYLFVLINQLNMNYQSLSSLRAGILSSLSWATGRYTVLLMSYIYYTNTIRENIMSRLPLYFQFPELWLMHGRHWVNVEWMLTLNNVYWENQQLRLVTETWFPNKTYLIPNSCL